MAHLNVIYAFLILFTSLESVGFSVVIIDQGFLEETSHISANGSSSIAQTFVPGVSGQLVAIDLKFAREPTTPIIDTVNFFIWDLQGMGMGSNPLDVVVLAASSKPISDLQAVVAGVSDDFIQIQFHPPALIEAGTEYALVVDPASNSNQISINIAMGNGQTDSGYEFGQAYFGDTPNWDVVDDVFGKWDLVFRTYVEIIPEPSTGVLVLFLTAALVQIRTRTQLY